MTILADQLDVEVPELEEILDLYSVLFNIRTAFIYDIVDERHFREITAKNGDFRPYCKVVQSEWKHRCEACDREKFEEAAANKEPLPYRCYNGLYEMFLPVFVDEILLGYLHFGQVRSEENFEKIRQSCGLDRHSRLNELKQHYEEMEIISKEKIVLISKLFKQSADYLLKNKIIELKKARPEFFLKKYIHENYHRSDVSVKNAAKYIGRSESFVTHNFLKMTGVSFGHYVKKYRIDQAKKCLASKTIDETWPLCGFKNRYHFSRVFKNLTGQSPGYYQRLPGKTVHSGN